MNLISSQIQLQKMDQNLTQLCDIDPLLDDLKIVARCISIWKAHPTGNPKDVWSLDSGNRVQATCKKDHINKFQLSLDEGSCYQIGNFGVGDKSGKYPLLSHKYKEAGVLFFDGWAAKFDNLYLHREKMGHVVMILQLAKVKYFNEKPLVSPALYSTKLYLNDDTPEIAAFRQRYNEIEEYDPKNHSISIFSPAKKEITPEEFFQNAEKKMINSICDSDKAKIHKIHREHGWAYLGCKRCGSKATEVENDQSSSSDSKSRKQHQQEWTCKKHGSITVVGIRYKVMIRVIDETGSASMLLFDDMIFKLCGVQVYTLIKQYGEEVDDYFPTELNVMIEKKLTGEKIPFNMEDTPKSAKGTTMTAGESGINASYGDVSGSSGSVKHNYIDLDDYPDVDKESKRGKKIVQVKIEPKD
ncbi:replication protein A 70 kDa DNA-binding subunit B [Tanacetum coccineum]|uniref:Replication protein A 70 kDa DNA-binding subunit B n=1 Tax=Tanacetum coccineum TaxID=301880 RepID=A0ABQ4Y2K2_9ASTR